MRKEMTQKETPEVLKASLATAMALGLKQGRFYRGATNPCVNLLVNYSKGCVANCAYCGLAKNRPGLYEKKSFINVDWPTYPVELLIERIVEGGTYFKRICISMVTNGKCRQDVPELVELFYNSTSLPISVLISPTILKKEDLFTLKDKGADMVGVAIDLATQELFEKYRGSGVKGPHNWERYWETVETAVTIFGRYNVGVHLIVGLGETEEEIAKTMQRAWDLGASPHLFSFYPEGGSALMNHPTPPFDQYLRVQLARYIIDEGIARVSSFSFDVHGKILDWGVDSELLQKLVDSGVPFMTAGCKDKEGNVACNRPFGNSLPGPRQWNYPYLPNEEEISLIKSALSIF